jgi:enoyl-CoA hydratase/carnithine racemase
MAYETLIVEDADGVRLIRLNRPEALNALNSTLLRELAGVVREAESDDAIRCLVITPVPRRRSPPGPTSRRCRRRPTPRC